MFLDCFIKDVYLFINNVYLSLLFIIMRALAWERTDSEKVFTFSSKLTFKFICHIARRCRNFFTISNS